MCAAAATSEARVRITAHFQGEVRNRGEGCSIGLLLVHLPNSQTEISLSPPDQAIKERFHPLQFTVQQRGKPPQKLDGMRLTAEKVKNLSLSCFLFSPGEPTGPLMMDQGGSVTQQETVKRYEAKIALEMPKTIKSGEHFRLELLSTDGIQAPNARLVRVEVPPTEATKPAEDSPLYATVLEILKKEISNSLKKCDETKVQAQLKTLFKSLHSEFLVQLEDLCKNSQSTKAAQILFTHIDREQIGSFLENQDSNVFIFSYNKVYVPFIDRIKNYST
jgi:hypothetical protein